ncbi:MAG: histidine kinase [Tannerella sp.]|nr:histidine kinase [Tannerella sp.]
MFFHLTGWALFVYLTLPHFNRGERLPDGLPLPWFSLISYVFLAVYFYCNNCVFVPRFLSGKKMALFLGITVTAYLLFCFVVPWICRELFLPDAAGMRFRPELPPPRRPDFMPRGEGAFPPFNLLRSLGIYTHSSRFLIVFIVSTGLKVISQWYAEKRRLQELETSMVQAELSFLKSQIHPHFLFNCLNSIYYLALSKNDKAPEAILSLSDFLRFVTTESNHSRIPMEKEIRMLEEYIHLQSLRASEKFELKFRQHGDFRNRTIMPLTFVPFVENAFKYGISAYVNCFIHISVALEHERLTFTCDNSIIPTPNGGNKLSTGIGLENIRKRLELAYAGRHRLEIKADRTAFRVKLQIDTE